MFETCPVARPLVIAVDRSGPLIVCHWKIFCWCPHFLSCHHRGRLCSAVLIMKCCYVKSCRGKDIGSSTYRIPREPDIRSLWMKVLTGVSDNDNVRVCSNHFKRVDYKDPKTHQRDCIQVLSHLCVFRIVHGKIKLFLEYLTHFNVNV